MAWRWIGNIEGCPIRFYSLDLPASNFANIYTQKINKSHILAGDDIMTRGHGSFSYDIPDTNYHFYYGYDNNSYLSYQIATSDGYNISSGGNCSGLYWRGFIGVFNDETNYAYIGDVYHAGYDGDNICFTLQRCDAFYILYQGLKIFNKVAPSISSVDYTLYIDGERLPNYNLNWNPSALGDFSKDAEVYLEFSCLSRTPIDPVYEHFIIKSFPFTDGSIKFNWSDTWQEIDAKIPLDVFITNKFKVEINAVVDTTFDGDNIHIVKDKVSVDLYEKKDLLHDNLYDNLVSPSSTGDTLSIDFGEGKDTDDYYDTDSGEDDEHSPTTGYDIGACNLTSCYELSVERLNNIAIKLWSEDFFSNILLLNNSPIENILSCKLLPLSLSGTESAVKIGNVDMGINGNRLSKTVYRYNIGTIAIPRVNDMGFLNYAPYTSITIFLPFIGFKELNTSDVMGRNISVDYIVDVITGACKAIITVNNYQCYEFDGNCGIDIPLTAGNRSQVEMGYVKAAVGVVSNIANKNVGGAISSGISGAMQQYHYSTNGSYSPATGAYEDRTCFIIIDRPQYSEVSKFGHTKGYKCQLSKTIGSLKGFVKTTENVDLSNISAPEYCKKKILDLLSTGIYI